MTKKENQKHIYIQKKNNNNNNTNIFVSLYRNPCVLNIQSYPLVLYKLLEKQTKQSSTHIMIIFNTQQ